MLSIIPATASDEKIEKAMANSDNLVLMKVYKYVEEVVTSLGKHDLLENAIMISRCGLADETITLNLGEAVRRAAELPINHCFYIGVYSSVSKQKAPACQNYSLFVHCSAHCVGRRLW